ncbi:MAG TPA: hypothetical protein VH307_29770 [Streptosporangiaceae bacterium]|nr:hypothetical protein [Streptosporangiaceae bacterium]
MRARILIAVAAWVLGAATATGGCLAAVSLLGDGFGVTASSGQPLTAAAVRKDLADAKRGQPSAPSATPSRSVGPRPVTRHPRTARPTPTSAPTRTSTQSPPAPGTVLTSQAGTVVATCESAGAYLISWSPAQGYAVDQNQVVRGPTASASVVFRADRRTVTMKVSCPGGTPVASTWSSPHDE